MTGQSACEIFGGFIASDHNVLLSSDVAARVKQCVQDSIGCLLAAHATQIAPVLQQYLRAAGVGESSLVGSSLRVPVATAAYANALFINALDYDDIYKKGHPGATTVAAALAMGEMLDCTGAELIESLAVGYDVCGRIGSSLRHREPRKLVHGHGTWQTFGAAATTAKLLRLDRIRAAHALAVAGVNAPVASVMKSVYSAGGPTMSKNNFGAAAAVGVSSAMLAREGYQGPLDLLEGETGFWRMAGADEYDADGLLEGLGDRYEILNVGFKPFSCCRLLQGSIEAVLAAASRTGMRHPEELARILLHTAPIVSRFPFNCARPRTMWDAQFSAPFACAMALLRIPPGPAWFSGEWYEDRDVLSLMQKTVISPLPQQATDLLPSAAQMTARATLVSRDGQSSCAEVSVARGEASNPMSQEELDVKFLRLAGHRLRADAARTVLARIHRLEHESSIRALLRAFAGD